MWVVVWVLNYTPRVRDCDNQNCPHTRECCSPRKMVEHCFIWQLFYWTSLITYLIETFIKLLAVLLDVTYDIAPVIERQFSDESLKGFIAVLSGLRLAFHSKVFLFFWDKLFHGDKDLFCEPCCNLEGQHETASNNNKAKTSKDKEDNDETMSEDENAQDETISSHKSIQDVATSTNEEKLNNAKLLLDKTTLQKKVKPKRPPPPTGSEKDKSAKLHESTSTEKASPDTVASTNNVKPPVAVKPTQMERELHSIT